MSEPKDSQDDHDPDYAVPGPSNEVHQKLYEENARSNIARKITAIVEKEFSREIDTKEKEILQIEERLHKALKTLHFLRYVIITDFYNRKQCQNAQSGSDSKQTRIHPAIKQVIGKSPKIEHSFSIPSTSRDSQPPSRVSEDVRVKEEPVCNTEVDKLLGSTKDISVAESSRKNASKRTLEDVTADGVPPKKVPRYVPPKSALPEPQVPSRGARHKVRKRIVVGNISKWIPPDWREDAASHKWTMYVRGSKENAEIGDFVGKVRFFLHPSYRPNDVVEVTSPPFHLSRRGWGEFPLRVQLHFKNPLNKPMDIIHYLKLDRTYTGLQTLGSETVVDVWIKMSPEPLAVSECRTTEELIQSIKKEPEDPEESMSEAVHNQTDISITDHCVRIKPEPREIDETASRVRLEHDYANFPDDYNSYSSVNHENNVTITHSPIRRSEKKSQESLIFDLSTSTTNGNGNFIKTPMKNSSGESTMYEEVVVTSEKEINFSSQNHRKTVNGRIVHDIREKLKKETLKCTETMTGLPGASDSSPIATSCDPKSTTSNFDNSSPKLQPLTITIPATFETMKMTNKTVQRPKQILILKDNKLIPIESMNFGKGTNLARGVSLLKKPPTNVNSLGKIVKNEGSKILQLNPNNSLILNATSDVPALKIVESSNIFNTSQRICLEKKITTKSNSSSTEDRSKNSTIENSGENCKIVGKITVGKDRIGLASKREQYEKILRSIDDAKVTDVSALVRFVVRRIPLISEKAADPEYRILHPYACVSEKEFLDYNVGKQRALEWYRAKHVRSFLKKKGIPEGEQWTIKEIMIWSRLHGYTPMRSFPVIGLRPQNAGKTSEKNIPDGETLEVTQCTFTEPVGLLEHLRSAMEAKTFSRTLQAEENVEVIDVESVDDSPREKKKRADSKDSEATRTGTRPIVSMGIPEKIVALQTYVTNTARQIGVRLGPEEIVPGVSHCAPARMIVRAMQCLLEDLLRSSLSKAWERSSDGGCPDTITVEDVRGAILNRDEFDVFTNEGLGSHHCLED